MKKNVNFIFFGLFVLSLIAMVGVMLYSDYTYHKVNGQYLEFKRMFELAQEDLNQSRAEIEAKDLALQEKERTLVDIIGELNLSKQKESSLSEFYTTVRGEKEVLQEDLTEMVGERDKWMSDYNSAQRELDLCEQNYNLEKMTVNLLESEIFDYNASIAKAIGQSEALSSAVDSLECKNKSICLNDRQNVTNLLEDLQTTLRNI